jgi:hypothetical protein
VEARFSQSRDVIGWGQSTTTGQTLRDKVVVKQFAQANFGIVSGTDPELDTTNEAKDSKRKQDAEERKLHRMANVYDFLEMRQAS